jgi:ATP-dependent RNA helicase RhlE
MPFRAFNLGNNLLKAVEEAGYTEPTPIQVEAIPKIMAGHDLIGIAQTGTGKTAAFVLPILAQLFKTGGSSQARGIRWLIVAPTRELVVQIEENVRVYAKYLPARIATVFGGVSERPQIKALRSGADLIIATPGRLLDLVGQQHGDFSALRFLVLDEAERMLDMGFIPQIRRIVKILPSKRQTLLFSATLSKEIELLTQEFLHRPKMVQIGRRSNPAETVTQLVYEVSAGLKPALLIHLLRDPSFDSVLVFTRTKHGADRIAKRLGGARITTATLHSNRSQNQRLNALKAFKSGEVRVLVATDIAARGIDVDGISHVVNFDFPMHPEDYVHRIGRTGRAQAIGDAISFVTPEDRDALRSLERFIGRGVVRKWADDFDYHAVSCQERRENHPFTHGKSPSPGNRSARTPTARTGVRRRESGVRTRG